VLESCAERCRPEGVLMRDRLYLLASALLDTIGEAFLCLSWLMVGFSIAWRPVPEAREAALAVMLIVGYLVRWTFGWLSDLFDSKIGGSEHEALAG